MPLNHASIYTDLTDEHYSLIGRVVVEWSNVEFLLGSLLSRLLFTPEFPGRVFSRAMGAARLQLSIKDALELHKLRYRNKIVSEDLHLKISQINHQLDKLRTTRNKFAHFCWARTSDNEIFGTGFSSANWDSKRSVKNSASFTVQELKDFHAQLYKIVDEFSYIIEQIPEMQEDGISKKLGKSAA
ncbi:hypothetical protein OC523_007690 [Vibrio vulnificus]|nr:hypothetical protein [Vibrio vulnificus]EKS7723282.1 hypothetical protein [Vibrio vulnificus]ELM6618641.1 hypothetical protein [Vibrio vulnificus]ELP1876843.1 hypothetical protein [Vibrio vulnificus]ELP3505650.1 hypothetical protein [Vibrio vulnificus]